MNALHVEPKDFSIAEVSKRVGVSPHVLRVWQIRYGWPNPRRDKNNVRVYSNGEVELIRRVVILHKAGMHIQELIVEGRPQFPKEETPNQSKARADRLQAENAALRRALSKSPMQYWTDEARLEREQLLNGFEEDKELLQLRKQIELSRAASIAGIKPAIDALKECGALRYLESLGQSVDANDIRSVIVQLWRAINQQNRVNELVHAQDLLTIKELLVRNTKLAVEVNQEKQAKELLLSRELPALKRRAEAAERKIAKMKEQLHAIPS